MTLKKHIPNFLTCLNLICGCFAIVFAFKGNLIWASYLVGIAALIDFLDGMTARLLNAYSDLGKQLDSLADMVTFGVVPGIIIYLLINNSLADTNYSSLSFIAFLIPVFSAIRLAKFNMDDSQEDFFIGLPTPANAILIASFPLIFIYDDYNLGSYLNNAFFLIGLTIVSSFLLISRFPMFSLKFKDFSFNNNKIRYVFLIISILLFITLCFISIPIIIILYIILSIAGHKS